MMRREQAETVALEALAWLAGNNDLLPVFLGSTGTAAEDLRAGANDPAFLAGVLDFVLLDDAWVADFAAASGHPPGAVAAARQALPGGDLPHWT